MKSSSFAIFVMMYLTNNGCCGYWGTTTVYDLRTEGIYGEPTRPDISTLDTTTPTKLPTTTTTITTTSTTTTTTTTSTTTTSTTTTTTTTTTSTTTITTTITTTTTTTTTTSTTTTSTTTTVVSVSYNQDWLRGDADAQEGHVHEGIQLGFLGFLGVGETLNGNTKKVMVKMADNNGNTVWTTKVGDSPSSGPGYSAGYSIIQVPISKNLSSI